ncbi:MAG: sigma 54-interacting transcriptional regulator [Desulfobulbaceae bacterium]|uniref:Sigma 54-interacting transcriptional regulator n=1 Tax=Candidatus Desulfatifera sulfidica TaxID=2841691 RepID=A0A8J6N8U6_9BACT|nr:sigma 54-interacting transcriptional regulator [Candidatus Desulfatifera sulfidica]
MLENDTVSTPILIIDDEESLRHTFKIFLKRQGYGPIVLAGTFEEAVLAMSEQSFDLIISDIVLEGASGIDVLKRIRELGLDCPVIMVTGYPNVETAAEAVRLGAFDYIPKPVEKETLLRTARLALQQRRLQQEKHRIELEKEQYRSSLDALFRSVADSIITLDRDLNITKMNQSARLMVRELCPDLLEGANLVTSCSNEELGWLKSNSEKVLRTGIEISEHRIECSTSNELSKVLSICISPLEDGQGGNQGVVIVIRDMTDKTIHGTGRRTKFHRFIGSSDAMQTVYSMIENVGRVDTSVLITGESGTGKELTAEALHLESHRKNRPLVMVDCTAIPETLLESELFGHKKGSFTGADRDRMGRILQADGGTLFLDEIGDITSMMQLRLLRFLQEKTFYPVGRDTPIQVDVRVITATNVDLKRKVEQGLFREDLYFRLRVIDIILPALRERDRDVEQLAHHFIKTISNKINKPISGISIQAMEHLLHYPWPGNIRELEHVIERACVLCSGSTLAIEQLPLEIVHYQPPSHEPSVSPMTTTTPPSQLNKDELQQLPMDQRIIAALHKTGGNKAKAARLLGMDRSTIYRKIREQRIDIDNLDL